MDVILFTMIALSAALCRGGPIQRGAGYFLIVTAGLLKFYPIAGLVIALRETPGRFFAIALGAAVALATIIFTMRSDLANFAAGIPGGQFGLDAFGATNILYLLLGRSPSFVSWTASAAIIGLCSLATSVSVSRSSGLARALDSLEARDQFVLIVGMAIVVGCFFAGQNITYRAIFLILLVGGLIPLRRAADDSTKTRLAWLVGAVLMLLWSAAIEAVFYPHYKPVPVSLLLLREFVWWWVVATLLGLLMIFAARANAFHLVRPWLVDGLRIGATSDVSARRDRAPN